MTRGTILLFAFCCGAIVANIYYAQPIIGLIAPDIHLSPDAASMIVSLTQAGYALGLFFLVPLGDLVENRKLTIVTVLISAASLATAACVTHPGSFLVISLLIGISSVSVQMLIPLAAHRTHDRTRGRVVGSIMSGLLLGILLRGRWQASSPTISAGGRYSAWVQLLWRQLHCCLPSPCRGGSQSTE